MRYALVRNGVVENVVLAEPGFVPLEGYEAIRSDDAGPGWKHSGGTEFFDPNPNSAAMAERRVLVFADFMNELSQAEQLALVQDTMTDPVTKLWYDKVVSRNFVDLDEAETQVALKRFADKGNSGIAPGRMDKVIRDTQTGRRKRGDGQE